jgi:hypothetical protein
MKEIPREFGSRNLHGLLQLIACYKRLWHRSKLVYVFL